MKGGMKKPGQAAAPAPAAPAPAAPAPETPTPEVPTPETPASEVPTPEAPAEAKTPAATETTQAKAKGFGMAAGKKRPGQH